VEPRRAIVSQLCDPARERTLEELLSGESAVYQETIHSGKREEHSLAVSPLQPSGTAHSKRASNPSYG